MHPLAMSRGTSAAGAVVAGAGVVVLALSAPLPRAYADLDGVNPVRIDPSDPANSSFLVFVEGDVTLNADESEGTIALGGDLTIGTTYSVNGSPNASVEFTTPTAPGDTDPIALSVGGDVSFATSETNVLRVLNDGFTKVGGEGFTAHNTDTNGASALYQVVEPDAPYGSVPRIEGTTSRQSPASVAEPVGALVDIAGAFAQYRDLTQEMGTCAQTLTPRDANGEALARPITTPGTQLYLDLEAGTTNVLALSAAELGNTASLTYRGTPPGGDTTLLVNVRGTAYAGTMPNQAGASSATAPYTLWNFPEATALRFEGGDSLNGTLYAPRADLEWAITQNIQGNVVARSFLHGPAAGPVGAPREIHDYPFLGRITCASTTPTDPTSDPTPDPTDPTSDPTSDPTTDPTDDPTDDPTEPPTGPAAQPSAPAPTLVEADEGTDEESETALPSTGGPPTWLTAAGVVLAVGGAALAGLGLLRRRTAPVSE